MCTWNLYSFLCRWDGLDLFVELLCCIFTPVLCIIQFGPNQVLVWFVFTLTFYKWIKSSKHEKSCRLTGNSLAGLFGRERSSNPVYFHTSTQLAEVGVNVESSALEHYRNVQTQPASILVLESCRQRGYPKLFDHPTSTNDEVYLPLNCGDKHFTVPVSASQQKPALWSSSSWKC